MRDLPRERLEAGAALDFVLSLKRSWAATLYPQLRREFEAVRSSCDVTSADDVAATVRSLPTHRWFAWIERGAQKMLWHAASDAVAASGAGADSDALAASPAQSARSAAAREAGAHTSAGRASVQLDPDLRLPEWYTDWDIHIQPGGIWRDDRAARVYELGAKLVMLGANDDYKFHRLFVETAMPSREPGSVVDLGCGFGKSTWPFKARYPHAEVTGVDLAAPCLVLAGERARERGLDVHFRQASATHTGLDSSSADLVTSTMFIHEVPVDVLPDVFAESARLLRPGGSLRFLDFHRTGDVFRDFAIAEHGQRNNEPYLPPMMAADLVRMARDAGFVDVRWVAFDERARGRLDALEWPARDEWHFPWAVLEAEKPR